MWNSCRMKLVFDRSGWKYWHCIHNKASHICTRYCYKFQNYWRAIGLLLPMKNATEKVQRNSQETMKSLYNFWWNEYDIFPWCHHRQYSINDQEQQRFSILKMTAVVIEKSSLLPIVSFISSVLNLYTLHMPSKLLQKSSLYFMLKILSTNFKNSLKTLIPNFKMWFTMLAFIRDCE